MRKLKFIVILFVLFINGCSGYESVHKIEKKEFSIVALNLHGDKKINQYLKKNFKKYEDTNGANRFYKIDTSSSINKTIKSKNKSGVTLNYSLNISIDLIVMEGEKILGKKVFSESVNYSNLDNKFELNQYEKLITKNQSKKIIEQINQYIDSIK
tara:strand:+ start:1114 stop:1578 length:465 start_codon:yes stop_codon:yes gene_type:complete